MYIKNLCRSIILIALTFTLLLGTFTDRVMAASEPKFSASDIQELNTPLGENESTQSTSKNLPSLQLGDGASNGAQDAVFLLQKLLAGLGRLERDSVNGEFSDKTEEAVKNYQKDQGITQDGKADKNTWSKLGDDLLSKSAIISSPESIGFQGNKICPPCKPPSKSAIISSPESIGFKVGKDCRS